MRLASGNQMVNRTVSLITLMLCVLHPAHGGDLACTHLNAVVQTQIASGQLKEAETTLSAALARDSSQLEGACAAFAWYDFAIIMLNSHRLPEAEKYAQRALSEFAKRNGPNDPALLKPLHALGTALIDQGMIGPARQTFARMCSIPAVRPEDRALVSGLSAALFAKEGKDREAEREYLATLAALEEAHLIHTANAAVNMEQLGYLYTKQGRFREARRELDRASATFLVSKDTVPVDLIVVLNSQAVLHAKLTEWDAAEANLLHAISLARKEPQTDSGVIKALFTNYAVVLRKTHRRGEARRVEAKVAALQDHSSGLVDVTELLQASGFQNKK